MFNHQTNLTLGMSLALSAKHCALSIRCLYEYFLKLRSMLFTYCAIFLVTTPNSLFAPPVYELKRGDDCNIRDDSQSNILYTRLVISFVRENRLVYLIVLSTILALLFHLL